MAIKVDRSQPINTKEGGPAHAVEREDQIQIQTGEKGWVGLEFTPYAPDDLRSSLLRLWRASITGFRSDGEVFKIPVASQQSDTPLRVGQDLLKAFELLETYRNCGCTGASKCVLHSELERWNAATAV